MRYKRKVKTQQNRPFAVLAFGDRMGYNADMR
jgi:hypothetical protein